MKIPVSRLTLPNSAGPGNAEPGKPARPDGRSARWADHRAARRSELIDAAIVAISRHGIGVGMDQIAAVAGTSKPVIYRYFADKHDLYRAMTQRVVGEILVTLDQTTTDGPSPREVIQASVDACFALLDAHPELFRFIAAHPLLVDEATGAETDFASVVANLLARRLAEHLESVGLDPAMGAPWGTAIVGFVRDAGLWWLENRGTISRDQFAGVIGALLWGGAAGLDQTVGGHADARSAPGTFPPLR
jgi:AcrR family transcriptional regulator